MNIRPFVTASAVAALLMGSHGTLAADASSPSASRSPADTERQLEAARQRLDAAMREVAELSGRMGTQIQGRFGPFAGMDAGVGPPRAVLGLQIAPSKEGGAQVVAVSPGGAAEAAGVLAGDRIVAIDGKDLTRSETPGRDLARAVNAVEPDRKVKLQVARDGRTRELEMTPRTAPVAGQGGGPLLREYRFTGPRRPGMTPPAGPMRGPDDGAPMRFERGALLAGMELATLSDQLGSYFGAREGVLVVRAGDIDAWQLRDGDVVLAIDGREPNSAAHATRILRSYQRGEKLQLRVLRERKTHTLEVTLPERGPPR